MASKQYLSEYILLGCLYVSQYIPVSFFYQALPVFLRQQGVALKAIGLIPLVSLPWMLKFLWPPLIDRYRFSQKQHYRPWIFICQSFLALTLIVAALLNIRENPVAMIVSLFVVGFFAATQDIATLLKIHMTLLAGKVGEIVVGICGLLLLILCLTGLTLWTGWRKLIPDFKIRWNF